MIGKINTRGFNINGLIEEYRVASGGKVNAGDFVKFVDKLYGEKELVENFQVGQSISVVKLSETKVFAAYSWSSNTRNLHAMVITIDNLEITAGVDTVIDITADTGKLISVIALDSERVYITYNLYSSCLYRKIIRINSDNSIEEISSLTSTPSTVSNITTVLIEKNKILQVYYDNSFKSMYGLIDCIKDDNDVMCYASTMLATGFSETENVPLSALAISDSQVFIAYSLNKELNGICCDLDDVAMSVKVNKAIGSYNTAYSGNLFVLKIKENKVLVLSSWGIGNVLGATVCAVDGANIIAQSSTQISGQQGSAVGIFAIKILDNKVLIIHNIQQYGNIAISNYICGMVCTIDNEIRVDRNIILKEEISSVSGSQFASLLSDNSIFFIHGGHLNVAIYKYSEVNCLKNRIGEIMGVAKTSGQAGEFVKVIIPKYLNESEEN